MGAKKIFFQFWHLPLVGSSLKNFFSDFVLVFLLAARWQHHTEISLENFVLVHFIAARWQHHVNFFLEILY
jgi:hypothetical protein